MCICIRLPTVWLFCFQLRYGEPVIRRAVPLALALISTSNPKLQVLDVLSKFSHDSDAEVAHNSILAMGIVGAGTTYAWFYYYYHSWYCMVLFHNLFIECSAELVWQQWTKGMIGNFLMLFKLLNMLCYVKLVDPEYDGKRLIPVGRNRQKELS